MAWSPGVARFYHTESAIPPQTSKEKLEPAPADEEPAPEMEDLSYLESTQDEANDWPSDERIDELFEEQNEKIDADPSPESAKPADTWYKTND